jgi:hypothetical protein
LDTCRANAAASVETVLDCGGAGVMAAVVGEFSMSGVLMDDRGVELLVMFFTGCVDVVGGASCSVKLLSSHVAAELVIGLVGTRLLDVESLVVLGTG